MYCLRTYCVSSLRWSVCPMSPNSWYGLYWSCEKDRWLLYCGYWYLQDERWCSPNGCLPYSGCRRYDCLHYRVDGKVPCVVNRVRWSCYGSHERWSYLRSGVRRNAKDEPLHTLYAIPCGTGHDTRGADDVRDGKCTSDGDDAMRSSDASTSHATSKNGSTTNGGSNPSTKDLPMRTMPDSRTSHRSQACKRIPVR